MPQLTGDTSRVLVLGFGNPGRQDDGLGPAFAEAVAAWSLPEVATDANYQLLVEDAEAVARHEVVVFADADASGPGPFSFEGLLPRSELGFTSHSLGPAAVLALAEELFGARPQAYLLGIRGYEFEGMDETLTAKARVNLEQALVFFRSWMCKT
jgi:hydrogenase maturation protease